MVEKKISGGKRLFNRETLADAGFSSPDKERKKFKGISNLAASLGYAAIVLGKATTFFFTARTDKGDTIKIMFRFINGSMVFIVAAMGFVGMIMVFQSTLQLLRAIGDIQLVGASFLKLLIRVLGPTVTGMLVACRVGAGIAAEIGAMSVTDQLNAMRICSADPIEVLVVPRLRAGIAASVILVIIGSAASAFAGLLTGTMLFGMSPGTYWNLDMISLADVIQGLAKAFIYGITIPVISSACGLLARGGARGVGKATTDAVVGSSFAIVLLDSLISLIAYKIGGQ